MHLYGVHGRYPCVAHGKHLYEVHGTHLYGVHDIQALEGGELFLARDTLVQGEE